ncbi:MAG: hypothetical protein KME20_01705 [Kaiparowitsia implicata GSE-PSE-MK54-09C]|nr:hypothetical protein [Kaiparowitsia implicata GSE-PSE-MK54-09C]
MPKAALKGRVAFVTGVSRCKGIGFAITQQLAMLGADVFIHFGWLATDDAQWITGQVINSTGGGA